jgi:predicted nucleic acid-binding OB-fold protein
VDATELRAFVGLLLLGGVLCSNREPVKEMWTTDPAIARPIFAATMTRDRFLELHRHVTFDDVSTREQRRETDRLAPIRDVVESFAEKFRRFYNPNYNITVDEHLVPFRGHCPFR